MHRPTIALCVIAKNEEKNIRAWHDSVKGLFDQYVFVDTGSTDKTVEIAKELGLEVHSFEWVKDFSKARQFSFDQAKTDYIMWNDLDDVLENREAFETWRDQVMLIGDVWLAPYHYSSDDKGNPVCTFMRERVVRNDRGFRWKYFIHEGLVSEGSPIPPRAMQTTSWVMRHKRTPEDLVKDRGRNLGIFEARLKDGPIDARMRFYYAKELFEAGKIAESIPVFLSANSDPSLELHDRLLCLQFLAYALMHQGEFTKARDIAQAGLLLAPTRAEFHCIVGDCLLKEGRMVEALPAYHAAKNCKMGLEGNGIAAIALYHQKDTYGAYPSNQIARILANFFSFEEARKEAMECLEKYDSNEARQILVECDRMILTSCPITKNAKPCPDIVFTTPPQTAYPFDPEIAKTKAMGGSETALIEMANWIKKKTGRPVKVFNMRDKDGVFDGVEYISNAKAVSYFNRNKPFAHIAWRHNTKLTDAPTYLWCHDLWTQGCEQIQNYDKILALTPFHRDFLHTMKNIPLDKIHVTRNGINPEKFENLQWIEKDPYRFVFSSSPDRGLDRAMRVLDKVREVYPQVTLHIHYGIEHLPKWGHQALHDTLKAMMEERKEWVIYHGATEQRELYRSFAASSYCVQPSDFIETSMISALERTACGVYQIIRRIGGLVDTLGPYAHQGMAKLVSSDCITESEHALYAHEVIQAMKEERYKNVGLNLSDHSWESVAEEWVRDLLKEEACLTLPYPA